MAIVINRRESAALINSLTAGVVPRVGLRHIAVGRQAEVNTFLQDLATVEDGGAAFRFVCGQYGSGKSFLLQMIRNNAMDRSFVVMDADLENEAVIANVLANEKIAAFLAKQTGEIRKTIVVKNKLVNLIVK